MNKIAEEKDEQPNKRASKILNSFDLNSNISNSPLSKRKSRQLSQVSKHSL